MKIRSFFLSVMAVAAVATGCQKKTLDGVNLSVDKTKIEVSKDQGEHVLNVKADCNWTASTDAEWFTVAPAEGAGDGQVTIYVQANAGAERTATLHFQKSTTMKVSFDVTVIQAAGKEYKPGDGSKENPYLASQASEIASQLPDGGTTADKVYVKGYVKKFASKHEDGITSYGNALFYITDGPDGEGTDFYCYQVYYLGGKKFTSMEQIKLGDEVVIYGQLTNYNGTYETVGKGAAYCYSINGETEGGDEPTPTPGEIKDVTVAEFNAAAVSTSVVYRLTGTVGTGSINTQYGNFDLVDATGTVYVYGLDNIADVKDKLVKGANIVITGTRGEYNGKIEVMNGHCEKIEGGVAPEPIVATDATVAEFIAAANPDKYYRLTGKVGGTINTQYGNFDLTDATGTVYVYGLDNIASVKDKLLEGADIVITGTYYVYKKEGQPDKIEVMNGHCEKIEGGEPAPEPEPVDGVIPVKSFSWNKEAHAVYGNGFTGTAAGLTVGYYQYKSTAVAVAATDQVRVYKSSVLVITSEKPFTSVVLTTLDDYTVDMNVLGAEAAVVGEAKADTGAKTVSWSGAATTELVLHAVNAQVRFTAIKVE